MEDVKVLRTSIDRPEIVLRLGWIPRDSRNKFIALRFLFIEPRRQAAGVYVSVDEEPPTMLSVQDIPKTVVFFDSRKHAHVALQQCIKWFQKIQPSFTPKQARQVIRVYHRHTAKADKQAIIFEFQRPGAESSEALGLGTDLPDVRRVVLYGFPRTLDPAVVLQRGGRASRDQLPGENYLL